MALARDLPLKLLRCLFGAVLITALALPGQGRAASQAPANSPNGIAITGPAGKAVLLTSAQIQALPAVTVKAAFGTEHGMFKAEFSGPLLWTVLKNAAAFDPKQPRLMLREAIMVTGSDGYCAVLAMAEIAPLFENKNVILATRMNGKYLGPQHFRIIVPGDNKGGRAVRDVAQIEIWLPGPPHQG